MAKEAHKRITDKQTIPLSHNFGGNLLSMSEILCWLCVCVCVWHTARILPLMISNLLKRRWGQCGAGVGKKETEQEDALQRHASTNLDR